MIAWFSDGRRLLAAAIVVAILVLGWMFRYEPVYGARMHQNRFTGAICMINEECWWSSI